MTAPTFATDHVTACLDGGVLHVQIDRPGKKNALDRAMYTALAEALRFADAEASCRAVLLFGTPDAFTAGNDLSDFAEDPPSGPESPVFQFLQALTESETPLVAAVAGPAVGIGTTLLLHCDLVYAAEGTRFQMPFVPLGLCPEAGSSYLVPRIAGSAKAAEWLLLGEPFGAGDALAAGLVNEVLPAGEVLPRAMQRAAQIAALPPASVRLTKQLLRAGTREATRATMLREFEAFAERLCSPEAAEAFAAFRERRKPDFSPFA
jgi:enoyl-CoA hydratase/carnithine racemase